MEQQKNRFTDAEMEIAKETDLPDLLESLGYQVRRIGRYHTPKRWTACALKPPHLVSLLRGCRWRRHHIPPAVPRQELPGGGGISACLPWSDTGLSRPPKACVGQRPGQAEG